LKGKRGTKTVLEKVERTGLDSRILGGGGGPSGQVPVKGGGAKDTTRRKGRIRTAHRKFAKYPRPTGNKPSGKELL